MANQPQDVDSILCAAIEIGSANQQAAYLDAACGGDDELRAQVEKLLTAHFRAGSFLEQPIAGQRPTEVFEALTDRERSPDGIAPQADEVPLDFLEPCDVPGRLGKIGPYEVIDAIGRGGMGVVLRAHDPKLNRTVAVKVMRAQFAANPTARKRFLREAQAAAAVTHPHVITIHAVDQTEKTPCLVMECIDALSLQEKLDRCGHLEVKEILRIGAQIAAGLAAAHAHGLVHRDIKPANILLENRVERVKITDFGLARAVDDVSISRTGEVAGTPEFMSPEQAQSQPVDPRSDLFSFGAVLYTLCTGRSPFRAESTVAVLRRVCDDVPRPIRQINPDIPQQLVGIIDRLLAKDPDDRFQTAEEVSNLLLGYLAHLQDPTSSPPLELSCEVGRIANPSYDRPATGAEPSDAKSSPASRWPRRSLMLAVAALLGLCLSVAITEATGVTHMAAAIMRITTGQGTLVVEVDDPQVSLTIDGEDLVITGAGPKEIRLKPGQHQVQAAKGGHVFKQYPVTIERGGRQVVKVTLEPSATPMAKEGFVARPALVRVPLLNQWVELLPQVDPACLLWGRWERRGDTLTWFRVPPDTRGLIQFPVVVDGSYDLQLDFTVVSDALSTALVLPVGGTHCQVSFDSWGTGGDGIEWIEGRQVAEHVDGKHIVDKCNPTVRTDALLGAGEHSLLIQVRIHSDTASIDVSRDGKPHLRWKGRQESISYPTRLGDYPLLDARRPGMSLYRSSTTLNRVRVRLVCDSPQSP